MRRSARPTDDVTGDAATGNVVGGVVLSSVLATQNDALDQVLTLTHLALGMPLAPLARDLETDRQELEMRVSRIVAELSQDAALFARLSGIRRAGQIEDCYPIIASLGLENWFCARPGCPNLINQLKTGRPRKTCSSRCRNQLHRGNGTGWQDRQNDGSPPRLGTADAELPIAEDAIAVRSFILQLLRLINYPLPYSYWGQPNIHCRDRALLLLGFTCPAPVTVLDLVALDAGDVSKTSEGLEVRLYKKRGSEPARYITLPASDDPRLCAAQALLSWRRVLTRNGRTTGPLFFRLGSRGNLLNNSIRLTSNAATKVVWQALREWRPEIWSYERFRLSNAMPLSHFLNDIIANSEVREAVFMLESGPTQDLSGPDRPPGPDPCEPRNGRLFSF